MNPKALFLIVITLLFFVFSNFQIPAENELAFEKEKLIERKIAIKLESVIQISNNSVGNEWEHFLSIKNQIIKKGEKIVFTLEKRAPITIEAHSIEEDKDYSDSGKSSMDFIYSDLIAIQKNRFEMDVTVVENGGQYAGNTASWKFIFMIKKA